MRSKAGLWLNAKEFNPEQELKCASNYLNTPLEFLDVIVRTSDGLINRGMFRIREHGIEWMYLNDDGDWIACNPPLAFLIIPSLIFSKTLNAINKNDITPTIQ